MDMNTHKWVEEKLEIVVNGEARTAESAE